MSEKKKKGHIFAPYLNADETVYWVGQPSSKWLFNRTDILLIPYSLMWGGFALFWEASVLTSGAPFFFILWGIPFVIVGQYMIWGRFIHRYIQRGQTWYAITQKRILIKRGAKLESYFLDNLPMIRIDGRTILFGEEQKLWSRTNRKSAIPPVDPSSALVSIDNAPEVYQLITSLIQDDVDKHVSDDEFIYESDDSFRPTHADILYRS